jgi:dihydrofolate reductase
LLTSTSRPGLVDELLIHLIPVLLGDGVRLFDGFDDVLES